MSMKTLKARQMSKQRVLVRYVVLVNLEGVAIVRYLTTKNQVVRMTLGRLVMQSVTKDKKDNRKDLNLQRQLKIEAKSAQRQPMMTRLMMSCALTVDNMVMKLQFVEMNTKRMTVTMMITQLN
ncbi:hypothetical protein LINGRAHAP2_LOCUS22547 [Linum grandiflorum]